MLSKPEGRFPIPLGTLGYFRGRNRWRIYEFVLAEFRKSGLSQADLARRLRKRPEVISRLLGAPGNWGLDTMSDLLFAISGGEPRYGIAHPLDGAARNDVRPDWLDESGNYGWIENIQRPAGQTSSTGWEKNLPSLAGLRDENQQHHPKPSNSHIYSGLSSSGN